MEDPNNNGNNIVVPKKKKWEKMLKFLSSTRVHESYISHDKMIIQYIARWSFNRFKKLKDCKILKINKEYWN